VEFVQTARMGSSGHESRNRLTLFANHHAAFHHWPFFIRFHSATKKYILVNYDSYDDSQHFAQFHGKAIALDFKDKHAPLPLLFLAHEYMVHGRNFYQPTADVEMTNDWQDSSWIINDGVVKTDYSLLTAPPRLPVFLPPPHQSTSNNLQPSSTAVPPSGSRMNEEDDGVVCVYDMGHYRNDADGSRD